MKTFSSKILLFGEHIINKGSNGLAMPFHAYNCTLSFDTTDETLKESEEVLELIYTQIDGDEHLSDMFDMVAFEQDIHNGLNINMNIPIGYGLGSSGAICAGVYDKYCHSKKDNPQKIKTILGRIESAFHGKSSGLDPLVSFLDKSVLVTEEDSEVIDFSVETIKDFYIFLVDTKQPRKTAPLVTQFLSKYDNDKAFAKEINDNIIPLTNEIITDVIDNNLKDTYSKISKLSALHLENFKDLILEKHLAIWKKGLLNNEFYLKICGAGGGGFMLGFCKDKSCVLDAFDENELIFI